MSTRLHRTSKVAEELGVVLSRINSVLRHSVLPSGVSISQARILAELRDHGSQRITALAHREQVSQPTMSALVGRLERFDWVQCDVDQTDHRAVVVSLTQAGAAALAELTAARADFLQNQFDSLTASEIQALTDVVPVLRKIIDGSIVRTNGSGSDHK